MLTPCLHGQHLRRHLNSQNCCLRWHLVHFPLHQDKSLHPSPRNRWLRWHSICVVNIYIPESTKPLNTLKLCWWSQRRAGNSLIFEKIAHSLICHERPEQIAHGCSFVLSDLIDSLIVTHLSWATWAIRLRSLIWFERNERWANSQPWVNDYWYSMQTHVLRK